ncbi:hypothetical protein [Aliarcobacter butzleri]|uniref:hypothetical protein n=1 Tax=Aliarcobacter butzleri TaxID=28197 RepID=UPI002B244435|nr:hypothetical protein [Aliarcobacter butzleri]
MKKLLILAILFLSNGLFANEKKEVDLDEFLKQIETIQEKTKIQDDSLEIDKQIQRLQQETNLKDVKARASGEELVKVNIDFLISTVKNEIINIEKNINTTSFIASKSGFELGNEKYKKVAIEDIEDSYLKILEYRKELNKLKDNLNTLNKLKDEGDNLLNNSSIESVLQNLKTSNLNNANYSPQMTNVKKNYINVKVKDKIYNAVVVEVNEFGIRIN